MKNIKPFGPTIGKTKISKKFFDVLNKEFDTKSKSKEIDYSSKLASQIKKELKISDKFIKQNLEKELKICIKKFLSNENVKDIKRRIRGADMDPKNIVRIFGQTNDARTMA